MYLYSYLHILLICELAQLRYHDIYYVGGEVYDTTSDFIDIELPQQLPIDSMVSSSMDCWHDDLSMIYRILDPEGTSSVFYDEFADQMFKIKAEHTNTLIGDMEKYISEKMMTMPKWASTRHSR